MNINIDRVKIITTIPPENVKEVRDAICEAGAGIIRIVLCLLNVSVRLCPIVKPTHI